MTTFGVSVLGLTLVALVAALPSHAIAYTGEKFAKQAKVTIDQARTIALQARTGTITDEELEHEKGGYGPLFKRGPVGGSPWGSILGRVLINRQAIAELDAPPNVRNWW